MRRRDFIIFLASAMAAWPRSVRAQQKPMPVIGYFYPGTPESTGATQAAAFRKGLSENGFIEGRNVTIEYRWAQNDFSRLPEMVADLVRQRVSVIATMGSTRAALAARC